MRRSIAVHCALVGLSTIILGSVPHGPGAGSAHAAATNPVPHYYGPYANYANSPLRMSDAVVSFTEGGGEGAAAIATVDSETGAVTHVDVTDGGSGYTTTPAV